MKQAPLAPDMHRLQHLLDEDYVSVPPDHQRRVDARLAQQLPWLGSAPELMVFNGHFLSLTDRRQPELPERVINLAYLNPTPRWVRGDVRRRVCIAAVVGAMGGLGLLLHPGAALALLLLLLSVVAWLVLSIRPGHWEFRTAIGGTPVCRISSALFHRADSKAFVTLISERADGASVVLPTGSRRVAAEIAEHRRMLKSGVLSQRHYQAARRRLLASMQRGGPVQSSEAQLA
ncbi:MAG: hypothetical protein ACK4SX_06270 [Alcanivoracaceae bacterium]